MSIAAPADKRFRRSHVKPVRRRERRGRLRRVGRWALLVAAAGYASYRLIALLDGTAVLHVSRVTVHGNSRLSTGAVMERLDGLVGRNILTTRLTTWRGRLLKSPWIEDVSIRRILPSTVEVTMTERRPIGICRVGGYLYLVDAYGVVIDEYGPEYADIDLPIIQGLAESLDAGAGQGGNVGVDADRAGLAARALSALSRSDIAERISELDVSDPNNVGLILKGDSAVIKLGREEFLERLDAYLELASALRERIQDIDYVDLRFDRRVYVRGVVALKAVPPAETSSMGVGQ